MALAISSERNTIIIYNNSERFLENRIRMGKFMGNFRGNFPIFTSIFSNLVKKHTAHRSSRDNVTKCAVEKFEIIDTKKPT